MKTTHHSRAALVTAAFLATLTGLATLSPHAAGAQTPTPDTGFQPAVNRPVYALALQADGKILVGTSDELPGPVLAGQVANVLYRLEPDGSLDKGFSVTNLQLSLLDPLAEVTGMVVEGAGAVLVGGSFPANGANLALVSTNGALNPGSAPEFGDFYGKNFSTVDSLADYGDGQILLVGTDNVFGGHGNYLTTVYTERFNADGSLDTTFKSAVTGPLSLLAVQRDGKVLVWGGASIQRLNGDGTLDRGFNAVPVDSVASAQVQPDEKVLLCGGFTNVAGLPRAGLARLNADGTVDSAFNPRADGWVRSLAVQANGKVLAGGDFSALDGQPHNRLGRLNPDGTVDSQFNASLASNVGVEMLALQADGKILVVTNLAVQAQSGIGRFNNTEPATQSLTCAASSITWMRGGASPEVWQVTFEASTNGTNWGLLGPGSRIPGGWQLTNAPVPSGGTLRARGYIFSGYGAGCSWFVETLLSVGGRAGPLILVNDGQFGFGANGFGFNLVGAPGQVVIVERSNDLVNWLPALTNNLGGGQCYFSDPTATRLDQRFYRARLGP
jgi:uncharacterized delta-60 repeat protein